VGSNPTDPTKRRSHRCTLPLWARFHPSGSGCANRVSENPPSDTEYRLSDVDRRSFAQYFSDPTTRRGLLAVLSGIARYGVTKPQLLNAPFLVVWNVTNLCNLRCRHCYQGAGLRSPDELSTSQKLGVVEELAASGVVSVAFFGGEPLMATDFCHVAAKVKEEGMHLAVATNGTLISHDMAKKLKALGTDYVEISLDFADAEAEEHDRFRGVCGAFERTMQGIKNCVAEGTYTCIATTVTKLNVHRVPSIIELARRLNVKRFIAFSFIPTGRGTDTVELDLTAEQREELLRQLFIQSHTSGIEVLGTAPQYARVSLECSGDASVAPTHFCLGEASWDLKVLADFIGGCGAGRLCCALQPNGDVSPCVFMPNLKLGNLREEGFMDIWHNNRTLIELRDRSSLHCNCGKCEYVIVTV